MDQASMHLKILSSKVLALQKELEGALKEGEQSDAKFSKLQEELKAVEENGKERMAGIQEQFKSEIEDCKKQIGLSKDVLEKKKEERKSLLNYLQNLEGFEHHMDSMKDFDWDSLKQIESICINKDHLCRQADILVDLNERAKCKLTEINNLISSTTAVQDRLLNALKEHQASNNDWTKRLSMQEKRINRTRSDTERLNMLVKQCLASNEPTSDYVTKSIQAKCHSFVESKNSEELLAGLLKFRTRQERIIKLLKYKDNKLGDETNKLQVARDHTQDQIRAMEKIRYA